MKAFFSVHNGIIVALFFLSFNGKAQSRIEVGNTVEFGGTLVSLNVSGQQRLQQEVNLLYADRTELTAQLEQLRQLDPLIQQITRAVDLPTDFRFLLLPFDAKHGYWNIPMSLLNQLGLKQTSVVNEQYHPLLATEAAVAYLVRLHQRNANGFQTLLQYIQAGDARQPERLMGNGTYAMLDPDSPALLWKVLARRLVFNQEEPVFRPNQTFVIWTHEQSNDLSLADIAFQYNLPTDRLQPFDRWLLGPVVPSEGTYPVLIRMSPEEYAAASGQLQNAKQNSPAPDLGFPVLRRMPPTNSALNTPVTLYEINNLPGIQAQPGDNSITLAFYGNLSVRDFLDYNDMSNQDVVRPGEIYYLAPKAKQAKVPFHVLERGQTMREVATMYGVRLKYLLDYNDVEANQRVTEGRVLWLQRARPRNQPVEYRKLPPAVRVPMPVLKQNSNSGASVLTDSTPSVEANENSADSLLTKTELKPQIDIQISSNTATIHEQLKNRWHTVGKGQTYQSISEVYGIPVSQIYLWNNMSGRIPLRVGQEIIVGRVETNPKPAPPPRVVSENVVKPADPAEQGMKTIMTIERVPIEPPVKRHSSAQYHIVRPGQTIYRVALLNKVTVEQVMRLNNLQSYTIEVGQSLRVR